ncbi:MAG: hypothetical protein Q8K58_13005 [Acidimicrobiales bacterium]|nr:hypothetical protein [Acidimicrobiales bacterium]
MASAVFVAGATGAMDSWRSGATDRSTADAVVVRLVLAGVELASGLADRE